MTRSALAVLALSAHALLAGAPLPAQTPAAVAVARLAVGATVRAAVAGARVTGRVQSAGPDTLVLALRDGAATPLALAGVDTIWQRGGRATGRGALIGAVVGGVGFASFVALTYQGGCGNDGCGVNKRDAAFLAIAVGGAAGALLGAGIGSLKHTWQRVHP